MGAIALARPDQRATITTERMWLHLIRNTIHFASQYGWALGLTLLPFATVFALEFTSPMWVALLAVPFLGERMSVARAGSVVLGLIGVLVIMRPGTDTFQPAAIIVLTAALGFATTFMITKSMTRTMTPFSIMFWMNLIQLPIGLSGSDPLFLMRLEWSHAPAVLGMAVCGYTSHFCFANALRHGDASLVVPLDFMRVPLIALVGMAFYAEPLDPFVFLGGAIIVAGVLWNIRSEAGR
jgi:drug/metabolite transporter (DMT)-like permease